MSYIQTIGEYEFTIKYDNDITIIIKNKKLNDEYISTFGTTSPIFNSHKIITSPQILFDILCEAFQTSNKKLVVTWELDTQRQITPTEQKIADVSIVVNEINEIDIMTFTLQCVEREQSENKIDQCDDLSQKLEHNLALIQRNKKCLMEIEMKRNEDMTETIMQEIIKIMKKDYDKLALSVKSTKTDFEEYKSMMPIMHLQKIPTITHIPYIFTDETQLNIICNFTDKYCVKQMINGIKYEIPIYDFNVKKFKYLTSLQMLQFSNCTFETLDFLAESDQLRIITLENMPSLKSIVQLTKFSNLATILIRNAKSITDIHLLEHCPSLKILEVHDCVDISALSQNVNFDTKVL